MRNLLLSSAAALILGCSATIAGAQPAAVVLTPDQTVIYNGWPPGQRTLYNAWPDTYRSYYWTLTPTQQAGWWRLTDQQRAQLYAMTPEQRAQAWTSIEAQLTGQPVPPAVAAAPPGSVVTTTTTMPPPPPDTLNKGYPVCRYKGQDNCQNPGEGGAPGRSRAVGTYVDHGPAGQVAETGQPYTDTSATTRSSGGTRHRVHHVRHHHHVTHHVVHHVRHHRRHR
ncbi:MAG: hypothetical protein JF593_04980 [Novosphingobium sp.]|nr:hypothetical protein [Novosphingobium sp.]